MEIARILKPRKVNISALLIFTTAVILIIIAIRNSCGSISVTGSAERVVKSDYVVWRCSFQRQQKNLAKGYSRLEADLERVKTYLIGKGLKEEEIIVSPVFTQALYEKNAVGLDTNEVETYLLCQSIEIHSGQVDKVTEISSDISRLIKQDIELEIAVPEYFYTGKEFLKADLFAQATENSKELAQKMLSATANRILALRSVDMDSIQILALNAAEGGEYLGDDTTAVYKKVKAYVSAYFSIK